MLIVPRDDVITQLPLANRRNADFLFIRAEWKQMACFSFRSDRGIKNRYLVACQDDGH